MGPRHRAKIEIVPAPMVSDTVIRDLRETAEMLPDAACSEQARLVQHQIVVPVQVLGGGFLVCTRMGEGSNCHHGQRDRRLLP